MDARLKKRLTENGQALIEIVLTVAIASIVLTTLVTGFIVSREAFARSEKNLEASTILQKEMEAIRSIKETAWNSISTPGVYHVEQSGNGWVAASGPVTENGYTRSFTVENVCREGSVSPIIDCGDSQAIVDPSTKKITAGVGWNFLLIKLVSSSFYITRYFDNAAWVQTTKADFDSGVFDNTRSTNSGGGAVELLHGAGNSSFIDNYDNAGDYTFDPSKIEVVGGFAQLKAQGSTVAGSTANSGFDSGTSSWAFATWGNNVSQSGSWQSSGGNPGGYAQINFPVNRNKKSGGYWYQPFTTTIDNPSATLTFDWKVTGYSATPDSFRLYAFVDTSSGAPNTTQAVWDSGEITGVTSWSSTVTVNVSSKLTSPGIYYLKIAAYLDYPSQNRGPYTVGFDNALLNWSGTVGSYPTDSPTIFRNISFTAPSVTSWNSFTETANTNGGSIRYQLSDDDGATWRYFNGSSWAIATGPADYNSAAEVNSNIVSFPTANNKINVKAFLISNGSQQVQLDRIVIGYTGASTGTFTSSTFDSGGVVSFNRVFWAQTAAATSIVRLQIAINTDNSTWNFVGPDGTPNTYFTGGSGIIPLVTVVGRYTRYKIFFTSNTNDKPSVQNVTVNYSR